ncbi:MAG: ABC transporter substrate-binding protein [Spirochaetales bacterium]|nr:ABC transporter substrate-binding protein [Spirochaetales bacterium]
MTIRLLKKSILCLVIAAAGVSIFSCGTQEKITVVLDWTINTNHAGVYAALEKGYFTDEGLDVSIIPPPATGAAGLLLSSRAQFGFSYQEEITMARSQGHPLVAIAAVIQHNTSGFASRKSSGIVSPHDFEGKRYGGWGSPLEEAMIRALMERDKGDFSRVKMLSIGSMDFFAATEHSVDFAWIFKGWDGVAAKLKGIDINFISLSEIEPALDYYTPVLAVTGGLVSSDPELIQQFLRAAAKGYKWAAANPEAAGEILLHYAPELDRELVMASQRFLSGQYTADAPRWGEMKLDVWKNYAEWLEKYNLLSGEFTAEDAFTNEFLPE